MKWFPPSPKDWTEDSNHENGNYLCVCTTCNSQFIGHKRRITCKECATARMTTPTTTPETVSDYAWCDMCGFNRRVPRVSDEQKPPSVECPDCNEVGDFCFLQFDKELPEHIAPDEPMQDWKP